MRTIEEQIAEARKLRAEFHETAGALAITMDQTDKKIAIIQQKLAAGSGSQAYYGSTSATSSRDEQSSRSFYAKTLDPSKRASSTGSTMTSSSRDNEDGVTQTGETATTDCHCVIA